VADTGDWPLRREMGQRIATTRKLLGWSQAKLEERCGVSKRTVLRAENGQCFMSTEALLRVAAALSVEPGSLLPDLHEIRKARLV